MPITGLSILTAIIPLVLYTLLILVRNIVAGFDAVPGDVEEAADGMGYTRRQRLGAVDLPLALPLIVAGVRVASVSTIGLVTITGALGDRFGGLGFFIFEGYRRSFPTEILFGAIPAMLLAIAVDLSLVGVQGRLTPWSRARVDGDGFARPRHPRRRRRRGGRLMGIIAETLAWLTDPAHWSGPSGIPVRVAEHLAISLARCSSRR